MIVALIKILIKVCDGLTQKLKYNINELNFENNYVYNESLIKVTTRCIFKLQSILKEHK